MKSDPDVTLAYVTIFAMLIVFVVTVASALAVAYNLGNRNEIQKAVATPSSQQSPQEK